MPAVRETVQFGTTHRLQISVETSPAESGKVGAFSLKEFKAWSGDTNTDLIAGIPAEPPSLLTERAHGTGTTTSVSAVLNSAGGGPAGENIVILTVTSSASFSVGDYIRKQGVDEPDGEVYKIVQIPDGTHIRAWISGAGSEIIPGDVIEEVVPTGTYVGYLDLVVDDILTAGSPTGEVRVVLQTLDVALTGVENPSFSSSELLSWTFSIEADVTGRGFRAG